MKNFKISLSILLILILVLFATNPTLEDFHSYIEKEIQNKVAEESGNLLDFIGGLISGTLSEAVIKNSISHENYVVFSIYKIKYQNKTYTTIGILNHFFQLDKF